MGYFQVKITPYDRQSSGILVVDNFHPLWKEAARHLMEGRIKELMTEYTQRVSKWDGTVLNLNWSDEFGLNQIILPHTGGLDLETAKPAYVSHNMHAPHEVGTVGAVITHYTGRLESAIKKLEKK